MTPSKYRRCGCNVMHFGLRIVFLSGIYLAICAAQQSQALDDALAKHLAAAEAAEKNHDYSAAAREYEEVLKTKPELAMIRQSLAINYHLGNHYPEAIEEFQRALKIDPSLWGSYLFLGMDFYKTNQFARAVAPLEKSIALNPKMAEGEARFWLGASYVALDKPEDAVRELGRDLELRANDIDVLYPLTKAYDQAAENSFQQIGVLEPQSAAVSLLQAERFLDENRRDLAVLQYRRVLALRPDLAGSILSLAGDAKAKRPTEDMAISTTDAKANVSLAALLAQAGDKNGATAVLEGLSAARPANDLVAQIVKRAKAHVLTANPSHPAGEKDLLTGIELIEQGHFSQAEEPLSRANRQSRDDFLQLLSIRSFVEAGAGDQVKDRLRAFLIRQPQNVDALLLKGHTYKQQAQQTLQRMTEIDADSYGVHELLGKQHEEKTEYELAIKEYRAALEKRPDLAGIRYAIGNVYRKMSQFDEAQKWLTEELARNPYHGLAHYRLGSIEIEQGRAQDAIVNLKEALHSHPGLIDAQLDLGRAYTADAKYTEAIATLKHVSALAPDNDRVHYLLSMAYSKQGKRTDAQSEMALYHRLTRDRLQRTQRDVQDLSNSLDK
jgi:tetratricopeptide (TPR) repeat protein